MESDAGSPRETTVQAQATESKATAAPTSAPFVFVPPTLPSEAAAAAAREANRAPVASAGFHNTVAGAGAEGEEEAEELDEDEAAEEAAAAAYAAQLAQWSPEEKVTQGRKFLREGHTDKAVDTLALALEQLSVHSR